MNSRSVQSSQTDVNERLPKVLTKNKHHAFQKPFSPHTDKAFQIFMNLKTSLPLILDSGCGTGFSTLKLSAMYPNHFIVGLDKSAHRLAKVEQRSKSHANYMLIRADQFDFWRLACEQRIQFERVFVLYPNPWPKPEHLQRRVHAHPAFLSLLNITKHIQIRSNWLVYLMEMQYAVGFFKGVSAPLEQFEPDEFLTPFEQKYFQSGQTLYKSDINLETAT